MQSPQFNAWLLGGLICLSGCSSVRSSFVKTDTNRPVRPASAGKVYAEAESPFSTTGERETSPMCTSVAADTKTRGGYGEPETPQEVVITPVGHIVNAAEDDNHGMITIDGRTFEIRLVDHEDQLDAPSISRLRHVEVASQQTTLSDEALPENASVSEIAPASNIISGPPPPDAQLLNLPSALAMVGSDHPAVGFAQWKVQEAYANLDEAEVLWLPSIQTGFSFHRHDGNYQASNGAIVDVNRSSFQYGLGAGATGAGTTPVPGLRAQFHFADAIFQPDIARKTAWATCHAEKAVVNRQLRDVAHAYLNLLKAHQQLRILEEVRGYASGLTKITDDFAAAGEGLQADADRMRTELLLIEGRIAVAQERVDVASARLRHAVSADSGHRIIPMDPTVVPIELVSIEIDAAALIRSGLASRPELKELQALVAAACDRYERQKYGPFVPSVLLGLSAGGFGGGTGNVIDSVDDRYDFDAMVTWEIRNLGFGERSARRRTEAQVQQAMFRKVKEIDDVAREISEAHMQVTHRRQRMAVTQASIQTAVESYDHNLSRIREGEGLPIEVLQSVKALESSRQAYLDAVIAYNEAQFQLQWAIGWQVSAPVEMQ